jgi:hypothetical protein
MEIDLSTILDQVQKIANKHGGICHSLQYTGCNNKLEFSCKENHKWESSAANIKAGAWCPKCAHTNQSTRARTCRLNKEVLFLNIINKANKNNLSILDQSFISYRHKYSIRCNKGHTYLMRLDGLNLHCKICTKLDKNNNLLKECHELATSKNGQCLSIEYKNQYTLMKWKCNKQHTWSAGYRHIKNGTWCPNCLYKNENETRGIFEQIFCKPFPISYPKFLQISKNKNLQLDGFNEELGIAFEYDGQQHYQISVFHRHNGKESLSERQQRDRIKDELCSNNSIKLVRVPYFIKDKKTYILNSLKDMGVLL